MAARADESKRGEVGTDLGRFDPACQFDLAPLSRHRPSAQRAVLGGDDLPSAAAESAGRVSLTYRVQVGAQRTQQKHTPCKKVDLEKYGRKDCPLPPRPSYIAGDLAHVHSAYLQAFGETDVKQSINEMIGVGGKASACFDRGNTLHQKFPSN